MQPPNVALQPGSTNTAAVKQLQDWLVANGYMTQAEVNTGYGTYGPRTTQAVLQVQQKLGVDNSTGPGYWGPRTMAAVTSAGTSVNNQPPATTTQTTPTVSPQKALLGAIADVAQSAATTGKPPVSFADALALAVNDSNIIAKYADMAKLDKQAFVQQLQQAQTLYGTKAEQLKTQFENERKDLAEKMAAAGTAYSGFRGKAKEELAKTESGIVTSTRSQLQSNLNNLTSAFESKYGTGATPNASVTTVNPLGEGMDTVTGEKAGDIIGTVAGNRTNDINAAALSSYNTALFPKV